MQADEALLSKWHAAKQSFEDSGMTKLELGHESKTNPELRRPLSPEWMQSPEDAMVGGLEFFNAKS